MKLLLHDIKLISEKKQVMSAILERYSTFEAFERKTSLSIQEMQEYVNQNKKLPLSFREELAVALDERIENLIQSEYMQINKFIDEIDSNIALYNDPEDINVLNYLRDLCNERKLMIQIAKINRLIAIHFFMINKKNYAIDHYNIAIELAEECKNMNLAVKYETELAYRFCKNQNRTYARRHFQHIMDVIRKHKNQIEKQTLFLAYYRHGVFLYDMEDYNAVREMMQLAFENATNNIELGSTVMNFGLCCKLRGQYDKAAKYYNEALEIFEHDDLRRSSIYNNFAELYKLMGQYEKAKEHIQKAIELLGSHIDHERTIIFYSTYTQIFMEQGLYSEAVDRLLNIIKTHNSYKVPQEHIIITVKTLIKYGVKVGDTLSLKKIRDFIESLIKENEDEINLELRRNLQICLREVV